jgi:predicted DNA-binding ribbon-helix-helix protein
MKSAQMKRSIKLDGRKTSVSIENDFWGGLKEIAQFQRVTVSKLIVDIRETHKQSSLASGIRIFVLEHFQNKAKRAGLPQSSNSIEGQSARA